ncbi:MAG TPA: cbb3-type cytochrome c oxidase subunit 3 [Kofleriaceae bacterium]|nr:cbb3-type cytochrome c oxidase subunit 3 [Kofleriaceae bacterium]
MSLSEMLCHMSPAQLTEIATIIFLAVFVSVGVRALRRSQRPIHEHAVDLPLADDAPTYGSRGQS